MVVVNVAGLTNLGSGLRRIINILSSPHNKMNVLRKTQ